MRVLACVLLVCSTLVACGDPWIEEPATCVLRSAPAGDYYGLCEDEPPPGMSGGRWVPGCGGATRVCSDGVTFASSGVPQCSDDGSEVSCPEGAPPVCVYLPPESMDPCSE